MAPRPGFAIAFALLCAAQFRPARSQTLPSVCLKKCASDEQCDSYYPAGCGNAWCDGRNGACKYNAWNDACADTFVLCSGSDIKCNRGPKGVPTGSYRGTCTGYNKAECDYEWCIPSGTSETTTTPATTTTSGAQTAPATTTTQAATIQSTVSTTTSPAASPTGSCCTKDSDCVTLSAQLTPSGLPKATDCGNIKCNISTKRCEFNAWNEVAPCTDPYYVFCNGNDSLCNKAVLGGEPGKCRGWNNKECIYEFCASSTSTATTTTQAATTPPTTTSTTSQKTTTQAPTYSSTTTTTTTPEATTQATTTLSTSTTTTTSETTTQAATPLSTSTTTTTPEATTADPATTTTTEATTIQSSTTTSDVSTTSSPRPASKEAYKCLSSEGKTACTSDADCEDPAYKLGGDASCGEAVCNRSTGACMYTVWNDQCTNIFTSCWGFDSLCYKGPTGLKSVGFCSGYEKQECEYAWCQGDLASPETTTTTTTTTTSSTGAPRPLGALELYDGTGQTALVNGQIITAWKSENKRFVAKGYYVDDPSKTYVDVTNEVDWGSSSTSVASLAFPGLVETFNTGQAHIRATSKNGSVSAYVNLEVEAPNGAVPCDVRTVNMRALVVIDVRNAASTASLWTVERALGYVGVPYHVYDGSSLKDNEGQSIGLLLLRQANCQGNYQSVIVIAEENAVMDSTGHTLQSYVRDFAVRTAYWYAVPASVLGFTGQTVETTEDVDATVTEEGRKVFPYLSTSSVALDNTKTFLAQPAAGSKPLLTDAAGNALALVHTDADGREMLTLTFASNMYHRHIILLSYGIIDWATGGHFIGKRRVYVSAHIDDYFIDDDVWLPSTPCGTPTDQTGRKYRIDATDLQHTLAYQQRLKSDPITAGLVLDQVYNAAGSNGERFAPDDLTPLTIETQAEFKWVSHGFDHLNEDNTSYEVARQEVVHNLIVAKEHLKLTNHRKENMVTGQVSGLKNYEFLRAAADHGVKFLVTDTTRAGEDPGDNLGLYNWFEKRIFMIPRRANNLFYNVGLREEWVAQFNCIFKPILGVTLDLADIIEFEANVLLDFMLRGEMYPWMFHQINLRSYVVQPENRRLMLLEELLDVTFLKYKALYNLPIVSPMMNDLGQEIISHNEIRSANVVGVYAPGIGMVLRANADTSTPVTGFEVQGGQKNMVYAGQKQTYVDLKAGVPRFIAL